MRIKNWPFSWPLAHFSAWKQVAISHDSPCLCVGIIILNYLIFSKVNLKLYRCPCYSKKQAINEMKAKFVINPVADPIKLFFLRR